MNNGWKDGHGNWKVQRGNEKQTKERMRMKSVKEKGGKQRDEDKK